MLVGPATRVTIKDAKIIENPLKSRGSVDGIEMSPNIKVDLDDFMESQLDIGEQEQEKGGASASHQTWGSHLHKHKGFCHGTYDFEGGRAPILPPARILRVALPPNLSAMSDKRQEQWYLNRAKEVYQFMIEEWGLMAPSLILTVTGDAALSKNLRPKFYESLNDSLTVVRQNTLAWTFTGGTNGGIMKLIGDLKKTKQFMMPMIGGKHLYSRTLVVHPHTHTTIHHLPPHV
jgi:hypothetical protein